MKSTESIDRMHFTRTNAVCLLAGIVMTLSACAQIDAGGSALDKGAADGALGESAGEFPNESASESANELADGARTAAVGKAAGSGAAIVPAAGAAEAASAGRNAAKSSPGAPITQTVLRQGTSSPSAKKIASICPATWAVSSNAALSVS